MVEWYYNTADALFKHKTTLSKYRHNPALLPRHRDAVVKC